MLARSKLFPCVLTLASLVAACSSSKNAATSAPGLKLEEKRAAAEQTAKASSLIELANEDLASGRYQSAMTRAEEALAANAEDPNAFAVLGAAKWRAGDFTGSTEAFERAVALDPKNFGAVLALSRNLQAKGELTRAIEIQAPLLATDDAQVDPRLARLWSYYALANAKDATLELDEIFKTLPKDDPALPLVQAYAAFIRPFADVPTLCDVVGDAGTSDAQFNLPTGFKVTHGKVGTQATAIVFYEGSDEAMLDASLAKKLGLKPVGTQTMGNEGSEQSFDLVLVPSVNIGGIEIKNIPARVVPLDAQAQLLGETTGLILGRQAWFKLGTVTFDFVGNTLTIAKNPPTAAPEGAATLPLRLLPMLPQLVPAVPIRLEDSEHAFWVYLGGPQLYPDAVVVTQKHYLKSGHRPRELEELEDPDNGRKLVLVKKLRLGEQDTLALGGEVLVHTPPDATLGAIVENTNFELGGYLTGAFLEASTLTYALSQGTMYIKPAS